MCLESQSEVCENVAQIFDVRWEYCKQSPDILENGIHIVFYDNLIMSISH